ncbi:hypothetical protein ATZ36_14930 [Candidatus Endomicrobiellum trichonymphae]|uniref:UvrD-like helicase C-terminal domain-containing protein n=1 Tax=Endomicrobium trichonymphae TaxID=1408204 RepID=A0A1E5ILP0_ENDTX|nr:hypothetical protein ATZ36_14930 [Candidatus Endomicrobium trichonymphae]
MALSAKGLEFDNTFYVGLYEGYSPSGKFLRAANPQCNVMAEERNLVYVAITIELVKNFKIARNKKSRQARFKFL